ncbi:hypothetical protein ASG22_19985 [Chryseobacterium sp. Leaf405]|uniref:hypothetical protein n=1 Tax=Chryseobacterium sp. Leaf405 TaxID=1736367 RepID=UPI0007010E86|nr:hypothetical protein [Chryseobacterium sp. Leaf405]KQT28484.1 hypothetical protein ASG22_19985 [Chryseobacterium sp. Leaf405]
MAIIIENESRCPICGDVLNKSKEYILLPPLTSNTLDELFKLSDSAIHLACLDKSYLKNKILENLELTKQYSDRIRTLMLENNPRDVIGFSLLSSDESELISKYNYFIVLRKDISNWNELSNFKHIAHNFLNDNKWRGLSEFNHLQNLLDNINIK